jgi:hydrogenase/urease accessory protein HupE
MLAVAPAQAHSLGTTRAAVTFYQDGQFEIDLYFEVGNLLYGPEHGGLDPVDLYHRLAGRADTGDGLRQELHDRLRETIELRFDGRPEGFAISFPRLDAGEPPRRGALPGSHAFLQGQVPAGSRTFVMEYDKIYGDILGVIRQGRQGPIQRRLTSWGEASEPYFLDGSGPEESSTRVAARYVTLGFEHILPLGADHILFVLGLYLLNTSLRSLLAQVTAFTIAHSVTLGMSMYGLISLPSALVETLIALSIAYVALENIVTSDLKPWRPAIVFGFGLLHGMGFAGVLRDLGLPRADFLTTLISFNVGVELGQLAVLAVAFAVAGWFRSRPWYRVRVTVPASAAIAMVGLYWTVERVL